MPLADKSCTLSIINRVVNYLKKHAEFEASNADDEVPFCVFASDVPARVPGLGDAQVATVAVRAACHSYFLQFDLGSTSAAAFACCPSQLFANSSKRICSRAFTHALLGSPGHDYGCVTSTDATCLHGR